MRVVDSMIVTEYSELDHPPKARHQLLGLGTNLEVRQKVFSALEKEGYELSWVESREKLEQRLGGGWSPDAILIELLEPAEPLYALVRRIKRSSPETEIIFIACLEDMHHCMEAIQSGAYEFLPSRIDSDELRSIIATLIKKKHLPAFTLAKRQSA